MLALLSCVEFPISFQTDPSLVGPKVEVVLDANDIGDPDMSSSSPPDGWVLEAGTWGTDIDREESTVFSGAQAFHFKNTATNAVIASTWFPVTSTWPGRQYQNVHWTWQASANGVNDRLRVRVKFYDETRTLTSTATLFDGAAAAVNTWQNSGFSESIITGDRWARFLIDRPGDTDFDLYVDQIVYAIAPPFYFGHGKDPSGTTTFSALNTW